jgi:hypothetical protein
MTLLTHVPGPSYGLRSRSNARQDSPAVDTPIEAPKVNRIAQVCRFALSVTLVTAVLAGIIALKASIYLARFHV